MMVEMSESPSDSALDPDHIAIRKIWQSPGALCPNPLFPSETDPLYVPVTVSRSEIAFAADALRSYRTAMT